MDLSGNSNYFDAETLTGATTVTFGTPSTQSKRFIYTFIPSYDTSASSVDDTDTWVIDGTDYNNNMETGGICRIFSNDGLRYYTSTYTGDCINEFILSAPFELDNAVWNHRVYLNNESSSNYGPVIKQSFAASLGTPECMRFNNDGTKLFVLGRSSRGIKEFHLSTAFDLTTISYDSNYSIGGQETSPYNLSFNADGTRMQVSGATGDGVDQYVLSTGFDVSTASFVRFDATTALVDGSSVNSYAGCMLWNADGTKMFYGPGNSATNCIYTLTPASPYLLHSNTTVDSNKIFRFGVNGSSTGTYNVWSHMPTLDRIHWSDQMIIIERGTRYIPTFATSFSGATKFFTRGYRHFLEFETHNGGSSYQLINHTKTNIQ
ncbi:MAG: hypothetical protein CMG35_10300 [Candidatus Marinimicrobia bacterium]|nr:hypothetical protein [Candidatus Neomarinimicrobiota bacterium]